MVSLFCHPPFTHKNVSSNKNHSAAGMWWCWERISNKEQQPGKNLFIGKRNYLLTHSIMPASHQAPVQLEPLTLCQILSTESIWKMKTLKKTMVLLDVHLSLPEANPFMVYLNKIKSRGRNIPDPKGFDFLSFGVLVEGDISCIYVEFL